MEAVAELALAEALALLAAALADALLAAALALSLLADSLAALELAADELEEPPHAARPRQHTHSMVAQSIARYFFMGFPFSRFPSHATKIPRLIGQRGFNDGAMIRCGPDLTSA